MEMGGAILLEQCFLSQEFSKVFKVNIFRFHLLGGIARTFINKSLFLKAMTDLACLSCKKKVVNDKGHARFLCPQCSKYEIVRCTNCRAKAANYSCPECSFTGPN